MKFKPVLPSGNKEAFNTLNSPEFEIALLTGVCDKIYGIKDVLERPAEFYVQKPDIRIREGEKVLGTEIRLTGVARNGRTVKQHHDALVETAKITSDFLARFGTRETFSVLMLDGEIPLLDDPTRYSSVPEYLLRVE